MEAFLANISERLGRGEAVKLTSFGSFIIRKKSGRPGRNPKTGQEAPVPAMQVVIFHASKKMKSRINRDL